MLNALELVGFKSFPDRTRFDFPPGITVVVGPNGSGKSNIVDAIKWVLGEQSARSLRGKEMADVIFKGSGGPSGRKPSNSAEATIFIDNSDRRLRMEIDEIRVTRRVYRSGESEYMINGEPCRLKDIRGLFRGTGIGTDAYSLIEQGKVEQLLQASPRDRRAMFEEAAGISRFKAKKIETERRLTRVEQNLVRLSDIVEEVEGNYRRVKNQASKAAKFKEYTDRLKALRTHVGSKDWRDFSRTLDEILKRKQRLELELADQQSHVTTFENRCEELDQQLFATSNTHSGFQSTLNSLLQTIAEKHSAVALAKSRFDDLGNQSRQLRDQLAGIQAKLDDGIRQTQGTERDLGEANSALSAARVDLERAEGEVAKYQSTIERLQNTIATDRGEQSAVQNLLTGLAQQISVQDSQLAANQSTRQKLLQSSQQIERLLDSKLEQLNETNDQQHLLQRQAEEKDSTLRSAREALDQTMQVFEAAKAQLNQLYRDQVGCNQRAELIQDLEKQQEGVDAGVKDLVNRASQDPSGFHAEIVGLVADLIKVEIEHAALIDLALGERAQHVVVNGSELIAEVAKGKLRLGGRVGLIQLFPQRTARATEPVLQDVPGVIGRLDQLVQVKPEHQAVIRHLLGQTWLVKSLTVALELQHHITHPTTRLITLDGEIVEADGSLICGSKIRSTGIVSRRSELRELHQNLRRLEQEIETISQELRRLSDSVKRQQASIEMILTEHSEVSEKLNQSRTRASILDGEIAQFRNQHQTVSNELDGVVAVLGELDRKLVADREQLSNCEQRMTKLKSSLLQATEQLKQAEEQRDDWQQQVTMHKVAFAKTEQQVAELQNRIVALAGTVDDHRTGRVSRRSQLAEMLWTRRQSLKAIAQGEQASNELALKKQALDEEIRLHNETRLSAEQQRREIGKKMAETRAVVNAQQDELHNLQMREKDLSMQRSQLATRLKDDYDIDIQTLVDDPHQLEEDRENIDQEINDLRAKLNNIGPVNMDALNELEELEQRYLRLDGQYKDLVEAKETLERIIVRVNADSRKLFVETLESIRTNFQQLFRQTFGGGQADLIIEEGVDVLEAGIDIRATPPGKPEFNNSLLSGGEKALTAVSLMMAIFKFRPSPFCILDEVDAPFDEANVGRFVSVLQSFLGWTKFVIVTHSKKTMTAATTLYGITMQESGVSKRVSVRFEDVSEKGEISDAAVRRSTNSTTAENLERSA